MPSEKSGENARRNEVGLGKWDAEDMENALNARDRTACGPVASPDGLYLVRVIYSSPA